jgi:hypothetical protein
MGNRNMGNSSFEIVCGTEYLDSENDVRLWCSFGVKQEASVSLKLLSPNTVNRYTKGAGADGIIDDDYNRLHKYEENEIEKCVSDDVHNYHKRWTLHTVQDIMIYK